MSLTHVVDAYWTEIDVRAMGTRARVILGDAPRDLDGWVRTDLERLEQCWSRFRADSELARVNSSDGAWVDVSPTMLLALTCARDLHRASGGRFDPTILDALERAGYDCSFELVPADGDDDFAARPASGFDAVGIDDDRSRVRVPPGARVDLGGVGKGLAADLIARGCVDRGARTVLASLGGDMRARGEPPENGWKVPVENPLDSTNTLFVHDLYDGALVTSTCRDRAWKRGHRRFHHLIDPRRGDSARAGVAAVVAAARDAWWAEGIAKAIVVAGLDHGRLLARDTGVDAWIFCDDGSVVEEHA